jgi:steroid 5-alpha reductase family enzyme
MEDLKITIAAILLIIIVFALGYFVWVGVFWLINVVFGTALDIWWGGLFGIVATNILKSIFGK